MTLTAVKLRELLFYDPLSGVFTNLTERGGSKVGDVAGSKGTNKYIYITVCRKPFLAHRLAWLYMTGEFPHGEIDHKDANRANNVFTNLRDVSLQTNRQNRRTAGKNNLIGVLGVSKNGVNFGARIDVNGERVWLGTFKTVALAASAYVEAKRLMHKGCTV